MNETLFFSIFLIFTGSAVLASIALYSRQPLIVAYIILGMALGPYGFNIITDKQILEEISHIGIVFLLFLLGLDMQPRNFLQLLSKTAMITVLSALVFCLSGYLIILQFGYTRIEALIIGVALVFSSTIVALKLLPTTVLHHKHTGEIVVGILLLQDIIAIITLILLNGSQNAADPSRWIITLIALPGLVALCYACVRWIIMPLLKKFDRFLEYIFLLAIGWCLGIAELASQLGLSLEIGAFIAGISLANCVIAQYIATNLRPLRDFFLILFFFTVGAGFNLSLLGSIILPSLALALGVLVFKPVIFHLLLAASKESRQLSWEVGFRLGQTSEFSLLIAFIAFSLNLISEEASLIIQATTIVTFLASTYIVVFTYPSPIAVSDRLRRD